MSLRQRRSTALGLRFLADRSEKVDRRAVVVGIAKKLRVQFLITRQSQAAASPVVVLQTRTTGY